MLQFEKERHSLLCILKIFTNIIHELSLKNARFQRSYMYLQNDFVGIGNFTQFTRRQLY